MLSPTHNSSSNSVGEVKNGLPRNFFLSTKNIFKLTYILYRAKH
jgi:hypothetical protein